MLFCMEFTVIFLYQKNEAISLLSLIVNMFLISFFSYLYKNENSELSVIISITCKKCFKEAETLTDAYNLTW